MKTFRLPTSISKTLGLVVFFFAGASATGQVTNIYGPFSISSGEVIWTKVFEEPQLTALQLSERISAHLEIKSIIKNVKKDKDGTLLASIVNMSFDYRKMGKPYLFTSDMISDGQWSGNLRIDIKDGKYRVTVYKLTYLISRRESQWGKKPDRNLQDQGTLSDTAIDKTTNEFKKSRLPDLDLISISLLDHFRLPVSGDELFSKSWE